MTKLKVAVASLAALVAGAPVAAGHLAVTVPSGCAVSSENTKSVGEAGYRITHEASGIELIYVPAGSFMMGDDGSGYKPEKPAHEVTVEGFWVGRTEVTVGQWRGVMDSVPEKCNSRGDQYPVVRVSWFECVEFCENTGLALPTERQWEYAARGPEARKFPWGHKWDKSVVHSGDNHHNLGHTAPVGSFPGGASWCGAMDMAGNVAEWCQDWFAERAYRASTPPEKGQLKVTRGQGAEVSLPWNYRCSLRDTWNSFKPFEKLDDVGLRVVLSAP